MRLGSGVQMLTAAGGEEGGRILERMIVLSNEGASLLAVLVMSNIKVGGTLSGPYKVNPANWHQVMVSQLS